MSSEGRTLATFGNVGVGNGKFIQPADIIFDNRGYLFVLDSSIGLIQKFSTPIVTQIEEALAEEQFKKLQELAYAQEAEAAAEKDEEREAADQEAQNKIDAEKAEDEAEKEAEEEEDAMATGAMKEIINRFRDWGER